MELNAQYGNIIIDAKVNAKLRGTGNYNPPPNYEQTVDRGNAYVEALNVYSRNNPNIPEPQTLNETQLNSKQIYEVGNTGFHPQQFESWDRTQFGESEYQNWARSSVQQDPNTLLNFFFANENVDYIQDRIVSEVRRIKKVEISKQSVDELLIIMRNHYQRALSGWLPHENSKTSVYPRGEAECSLTSQISRLNKSVLEECVKQIVGGVDMYKQYYKDASSLPIPLSHPTYVTQKGSMVLSESVGFSNGHAMTRSIDSYNQQYNIM
jgi:hypothetical protein